MAITDPSATTQRRDPWLRAAALTGVVVLPLVVVATVLSDVAGSAAVNPGSSDATLLETFAESRDRQMVAAALYALAGAATLVFLGPLWARLRTGSEWLAVVAVAGGVAGSTLWVVLAAGWSLTAATAAEYNDANAARFLMVTGWETARLSVAPHLVMVAAATLAGARHHVFGRWFNLFGFGWIALLTLGLFPASPAGLAGMLSTSWILVAGLVLAFGQASPPPAADPHRTAGRRTRAGSEAG